MSHDSRDTCLFFIEWIPFDCLDIRNSGVVFCLKKLIIDSNSFCVLFDSDVQSKSLMMGETYTESLGCTESSGAFRTPSNDPNILISSIADFSPIPEIPFTIYLCNKYVSYL